MHQESDTKEGKSCYRLNYYPVAASGREDAVGFGAHTDYTTITFLFSNASEGFQVSEESSHLTPRKKK